MNNRDLVRSLIGDKGVPMQDVASGDASTTVMFLSAPPVATSGVVVAVASVVKTETTDYTIDRTNGKVTFVSAPAAAEDNVTIEYRAVKLSDTDIDDILTVYGITAASTVETGPTATLLSAAAEVADAIAADMAERVDTSADGQSLSRSQAGAAYTKVADRLRDRARRAGGIVAIPVIRMDAYNADEEVDDRSTDETGVNPRRRFYGERDRLP